MWEYLRTEGGAVYGKLLIPLLFASALLAAGCGGGQQKPQNPTTVTSPALSPADIKWTYQINAISLILGVDKNLNEYQGAPHALLLCVYQLSSQNKFKEMAGTSTGLNALYDCKSFDASVTHVQRVFVQPSQNATLSMDRAEGTKFMAVAAGYYDLQGTGATRTWQIPMETSEKGMLFWKDTLYAPAKLDAMLILGPHELQKVGE